MIHSYIMVFEFCMIIVTLHAMNLICAPCMLGTYRHPKLDMWHNLAVVTFTEQL